MKIWKKLNLIILLSNNAIIDFQNIKVGDITDAATRRLKEAEIILRSIINIPAKERNFENTLLMLDNLYNTIYKIWNLVELLSSTHPSLVIQEEALKNELVIQHFMSNLAKNENLYCSRSCRI